MKLRTLLVVLAILVVIVVVFQLARRPEQVQPRSINLPSSKALYVPAPGQPQPTNSFPTADALRLYEDPQGQTEGAAYRLRRLLDEWNATKPWILPPPKREKRD